MNKKASAVKGKRYIFGKLSRVLAMATLIAMMMAVFGVGALPAAAVVVGTSWGDAIHIKTASDLAGISSATQAGMYYVLDNDIDLSSYPNWTPITDTQGSGFFGHFDGNGHTISNLTINDASSGDTGTGLFESLGHGYTEVKNLTLTKVNITSTNKGCEVDSLTPFLEGSVTNCHVFGTVSGLNTVGGLIGSTDDGTKVTDCSFSGSVSGTDEIGGLVGHHDGLMTGCFTHGLVSGQGAENGVGGLAGECKGNPNDGIVNCYSDASISGSGGAPYVGGLVGRGDNGSISNSYFVGSVSASGSNDGWGTGGLAGAGSGTISNCYVGGPVYNPGSNFVGVLVGRNACAITGSYWDQEIAGQTNAIGHVDGSGGVDAHGVSTADMLTQAAGSPWAINQGSSFPYLTGVSNTEPTGTVNIVLQLGIPTITVNGVTTLLDTAPEINAGHTFLPIRPVVVALGGSLTYDQASKQLTITSNGTTIVLVIGQSSAQVNGQTQTLDAAPYVSNGRTMLPLRFIAQNLGCQVAWDGATRQATVSYPQSLYPGS